MRAKWQARLCSANLTEIQFTEIMAEAIREKLGRDVEMVGPLELVLHQDHDGRMNVFLANDWAAIERAEPMDRMEHIRQRTLAVAESIQRAAPELELPDVQNVVPVIKDDRFIADIKSKCAGTMPFVQQRLVADLSVFYVIDRQHTMEFVSLANLNQWKLTVDQLHTAAIKNLRRLMPEVKQYGDGPAWMFVVNGDYEASLLLLPEVWRKVAPTIAGELLACAPARDMMLFTGTKEIGGREALGSVARKTLAGGDHLISGTVLRWSDGKWVADSTVERSAKPWWKVW